jgi:hypothetical protein
MIVFHFDGISMLILLIGCFSATVEAAFLLVYIAATGEAGCCNILMKSGDAIANQNH